MHFYGYVIKDNFRLKPVLK